MLNEELLKKWQPVLEHPDLGEIKDPHKRAVVAQLLENQAPQIYFLIESPHRWSTCSRLPQCESH